MLSIHQNLNNSISFLKGYKQLKIPIQDKDGNPVWPELFPASKIEQMREMVGLRHFSSQMMLEYVSEEKLRLDPGALHFYSDLFDVRTAKIGDHIITGAALYWDPSAGRQSSDSSVCVLVYKDDKNRLAFIHDIVYLRISDSDMHPLATQCKMVLDFMRMHSIRKIAIEVNGLGNALPEILTQTATKLGQPVIVQKIVNHQRKELRILDSLEPLLSTGRLFVHNKIQSTPLLSEMLGWSPIGGNQHDDGLDAVSGALRITPCVVRGLGSVNKIIKANTNFKI